MRIGILGGTFNPIHFGHLRAAEEVRFKINLDKIIFMPSGNPPLKGANLIEASHRYSMTKLATDPNADFLVSDIEMRQAEKSYTVNTIAKLKEIYPDDELFFILGMDAFLDIPNWRHPDALIGMADFIIVNRPGFDLSDIAKSPYAQHFDKASRAWILKGGRKAVPLETTPIGISSTEIRRLLKDGKSIKYLLPDAVEKYIYGHKLYI
jgi:nicotinate-nucleotide adenylyltransferase